MVVVGKTVFTFLEHPSCQLVAHSIAFLWLLLGNIWTPVLPLVV